MTDQATAAGAAFYVGADRARAATAAAKAALSEEPRGSFLPLFEGLVGERAR